MRLVDKNEIEKQTFRLLGAFVIVASGWEIAYLLRDAPLFILTRSMLSVALILAAFGILYESKLTIIASAVFCAAGALSLLYQDALFISEAVEKIGAIGSHLACILLIALAHRSTTVRANTAQNL